MGEVTHTPDENHQDDNHSEESDNSSAEEYFDDDDVDVATSEELTAIDNKLDALNLVLDAMETKRENIHMQLMELLKSSQNIRKEFQEEKEMQMECSSKKSE